ncbi:MAG: hypothetical protein J1F11_10325 [Oscillospiraceae bacterium]|nr:hypothetical protein [Oscillospiraceae bacterium]
MNIPKLNNSDPSKFMTERNDLVSKKEKSPVEIKKSTVDRFEYSGVDELAEMHPDAEVSSEPAEEQEALTGQTKAEEAQTEQEEKSGDQSGSSGKVGINAGKLARMLAAAKTRSQVQAVIAKIRADLQECEAGESNGMDVDEASVKAAEQLLQQANALMSSAENREATPEEEMAAALASLM